VAQAKAKCRVAPADEYFGRLKMSILGIRNVIKDQGLRVDYEPDKAASTLSTIALAEDALHDWEHKYPCDSWLPGTIYALEHFYLKIHTLEGVQHVHATFAWLRHDYPKARVITQGRTEDGLAAVDVPVAAESPLPGGPLAGATGAPASTANASAAASSPTP
jgi:hypothetical protein